MGAWLGQKAMFVQRKGAPSSEVSSHLWMTWPREQIPERISPSLGALCSAHPAQLYVVTSRRMLPVFNSRWSLSPVPCSFMSKPEELLQGSRTHGRSPESPVWLSSVARA